MTNDLWVDKLPLDTKISLKVESFQHCADLPGPVDLVNHELLGARMFTLDDTYRK